MWERVVDIHEIKPLITIHSIPYSLSFPFSKIYKIVQNKGVHIIHALDDYSTNTALAASVSWVTNIPFVYTIQGIGVKTGYPLVDTIVELYDRTIGHMIVKKASKVILLSKRLMLRAKKLGVKKRDIAIIPSGVDYEHFDPERPEVEKKANLLRNELNIGQNIVIGYVGRLIPAKGLTYLMLAVKQIQRENPNVVLLVVGDGPQKEDLEIMAKDLGIKAIFTGWQPDTPPYYAIMDVFALPSFFEGLPNVILEAMAMEKPIVATDVGGNPDLVKDGENGLLVPIRNYQQMAFALEKLALSSSLRNRMGVMNKQKIRKFFVWDEIIKRVEEVYHEIA